MTSLIHGYLMRPSRQPVIGDIPISPSKCYLQGNWRYSFITAVMTEAYCKKITMCSTYLLSVNFPDLFSAWDLFGTFRFAQYFAVQTFLPLCSFFLHIVFPPVFPGCYKQFILWVHVILQNLVSFLFAILSISFCQEKYFFLLCCQQSVSLK